MDKFESPSILWFLFDIRIFFHNFGLFYVNSWSLRYSAFKGLLYEKNVIYKKWSVGFLEHVFYERMLR